MNKSLGVFNDAVSKILRPIVRLSLERGLTLDSFIDIAKKVFVDVASNDFLIEGKKQTKSRIAALTGINRKEVSRVKALPDGALDKLSKNRNRSARVLSAWLRDNRYLDKKGDPRPLSLEGKNSFSDLVKNYSGDIPVRTIVDELQRLGMIDIDPQEGLLQLNSRGYVPEGGLDEYLEILGADTEELMTTILFNMQSQSDYKLYQRKSVFRNVPTEYLAAFRSLSARMSNHLLEELDRWLADHDRDINPNILGTGRAKIGIGVYQIESIIEDSAND